MPEPIGDPEAEIARLNKVVTALMDRAERATRAEGSDYRIFETTLMLEEEVRRRTEELQAALEANRILQARLQEQATRDALTGLFNRRYLEETLARELARARRASEAVTLILGDLDHFKSINDRHGHAAGDEVLRVFATVMERNARASDICCRYGGEEFLLVLPGAATDAGLELAEALRRSIAKAHIAFGESTVTLTASFGVASYPVHADAADTLVAAADEALYAAKAAGRNRVEQARARARGGEPAGSAEPAGRPLRAVARG